MKLSDVVKVLNGEVYTPDIYDGDLEIDYAFSSDLMSDALMLLRTAPDEFFSNGCLITGLVTKQSIRTAEMLDFKVVIIVRDKSPNENVFESAIEEGIIVIGTPFSMFSTSGRLYQSGLKGVSEL